jgi:hypothetical protein
MLAPLQLAHFGALDLLSPGRRIVYITVSIGCAFRSQVVVPLPDQQGRADILAVHLRQRPLALSIGDKPALCQTVARMTRGEAPWSSSVTVLDCVWPLKGHVERSHVVRLLGKGCSMVWQQSRPLSILQDRLVRQRAASSGSICVSNFCHLTGSLIN